MSCCTNKNNCFQLTTVNGVKKKKSKNLCGSECDASIHQIELFSLLKPGTITFLISVHPTYPLITNVGGESIRSDPTNEDIETLSFPPSIAEKI